MHPLFESDEGDVSCHRVQAAVHVRAVALVHLDGLVVAVARTVQQVFNPQQVGQGNDRVAFALAVRRRFGRLDDHRTGDAHCRL